MSELKIGTVGYLHEGDQHHSVIVGYVFADGRVLFKYMALDQAAVVKTGEGFTPSRDAYVSIGSYVEPVWDGDSCRCTNYWRTPLTEFHAWAYVGILKHERGMVGN